MKKKLAYIIILFFTVIFLASCGKIDANSYLRIHIRANSNLQVDQDVKYEIKEKVTSYLTPFLSKINSKQEVMEFLNGKTSEIKHICDSVLLENNFNYISKVEIKNELFPTRYYGELVLASDYYDAIIISLGNGEGDNWWCVVYPPLCFTENTNNIVYKSKLLEIINKFFN